MCRCTKEGGTQEGYAGHGDAYLSEGMREIVVGETGCENAQPNMGCDPVPVTKQEPNRRLMALRVR